MNPLSESLRLTTLPPQLRWGLLLVAAAWPLNWFLDGIRTIYLFFPLWLGYILIVDGLVWLRRGSSLLSRDRLAFAGLFVISAPAWWLFEALNWRVGNWEYLGSSQLPALTYAVTATVNFSTVIPAIFSTAELVSTFAWIQRLGKGPVIRPTRRLTIGLFLAGWLSLALTLLWPRVFFPFLWLSIYFIVAPVNVWLRHRSLSSHTARGDWRPVVALWLGALICGLFWEMWNYYSFPKWIYHVPGVDFMRIFEMPLLGYGGYLPFSLELFALYHLVVGLLGLPWARYVQLGAE